jgi:hypothetical protein
MFVMHEESDTNSKAAQWHKQSSLGFSPNLLADTWTEVQTTLPKSAAANFSVEMPRISMEHPEL